MLRHLPIALKINMETPIRNQDAAHTGLSLAVTREARALLPTGLLSPPWRHSALAPRNSFAHCTYCTCSTPRSSPPPLGPGKISPSQLRPCLTCLLFSILQG